MTLYFEEPVDDVQPLPCGICSKSIGKNHRFINCNICNFRVHIKCNKTDLKTYEKINDSDTIFCIKCQEEIIPFQKLTDYQFYATSKKGINNDVDQLNLAISHK